MFINLSNHPSERWSQEQHAAAAHYGKVIDIPFPQIAPEWSAEEVECAAEKCVEQVRAAAESAHVPMCDLTVMVSGEFTCTFHLVLLLKELRCRTVAACTARKADEVINSDGSMTKTSTFRFVQFREY